MKTCLEIEFKTAINEETYNKLIKKYNLENNIKTQINHYFDTSNKDVVNSGLVLRIRQKGNHYKITSKTPSKDGTIENHIQLEENEAINILEKGFDANIIGIPHFVNKVAELTTHRVTIPYEGGIMFFDKNNYYNATDYEIEYEVNEFAIGETNFNKFLLENEIPFVKTTSKTKRALRAAKIL